MTGRACDSDRYFLVTSQGVSATRWLSFVLASHPEVFVAHGHFPIDSVVGGEFQQEKSKGDTESLSIGNAAGDLYETNNLEDVFAAYRSLKPEARAYGNVHSYTLDLLMQNCAENSIDLSEFALANVVRHPVSYIEGHFSLVRKAERYPAVYQSYAGDIFPKALREFSELFLMDCPDFREFLAFTSSCYSALNVARDLAYEQVRHFQMELLTRDAKALASFCRALTGLDYDDEQLRAFIQSGPINRHRESSDSTDEMSIYRSWPGWKRDIAAVMISETALTRFEGVGYEVGMLRDGFDQPETERLLVPCLADRLKVMDEDHPYLAALEQNVKMKPDIGHTSQPKLLESLLGYNIVQFGKAFFALSQSLGEVHVTDGAQALIERHGDEKVIVTDTIADARKRIREVAGVGADQ